MKPTPKAKRVPDYMLNPKYRDFSDQTLNAVNDWLERHPEPVFYSEGVSSEAMVTPTGYKLISGAE